MSTIEEARMKSLTDKLVEIEKQKLAVVDELEKVEGDKKVKIKRVSLKGSKNPKKGK